MRVDKPHETLLYNLADYLDASGYITLRNLQLGGSWIHSIHNRPGIADVMCFKPSYTNMMPRIFEIKVSRSDLMGDIRKEKWRKYIPFCEYVSFAFPRGMATSKEIPDDAGIWAWDHDKKSWHCQRRGARHTPTFNDEFWMAALLNQKNIIDRKIKRLERRCR